MRLPIVVVLLIASGSLAACWRGGDATDPAQPSFIARKNALVELRRSADAVFGKLERTMQQIIGLASEAERDAIRGDLDDIDHELVQLSRYTVDVRARGEQSALLDDVERKLERAALVLLSLREELRYAKTTAELAALDELSRDEATQQADERRDLLRQIFVVPAQLDERVGRTIRIRSGVIETP